MLLAGNTEEYFFCFRKFKSMKKIILLTSVLVITSSAIMAQQTSFGIKAGIQQSTLSTKISEDDIDATLESPRIGFIFGGVANIKFSENFSVQPNLLLVSKPSRLVLLGSGDISTMSIDVPINLFYNNNGFFIGAGPNLSYGISSKFKPWEDGEEDQDLYKGEDGEDAPFKRFEFGVNASLGYQFASGLTISGNFTRGFNNLVNTDFDDYKWNYKHFGLSIGYMFGGTKTAAKK